MTIASLVGGVIVLLGFALLVVRQGQQKVERLRERGLYPQPGQESQGDVDRLLQHGHKIEAIKVYRAIHRADLKAAKDAVEQRQRQLGLH